MRYPALDVRGADPDLVAAIADDYSPSAIDDSGQPLTIFFSSANDRDSACRAIASAFPAADLVSREVDDEDWARRSQENLQPIVVGRITVSPPWASGSTPIEIIILPSMGFGTGHHATTRLCLAALQTLDLHGKTVIDVGTGSGVLALAARRLGAARVIGLDYDPDAIQSATESLALNPAIDQVTFVTIDLRDQPLPRADVMTANLTGVLLQQSASQLVAGLAPGGTLIVSGLQAAEKAAVKAAFDGTTLVWEQEEAGWVGLAFNASPPAAV
jgi:ribosomal protein L11 methyltransferase